MTREVVHQKMFQAALDSIEKSFPPGTLAGGKKLGHAYVADSGNFGGGRGGGETGGFELAQANSQWGFELNDKPVASASTQKVQ
jgi:Mn-containing catalase